MKYATHSTAYLMILATMTWAGQHSSDPKAIFEKAQRALFAGRYTQAENGFRDVLKLDPSSAAAYDNLGVVFMRQRRWDLAAGAFNHALKLAPQIAGININLGLVYYHERNFPKAIPEFERVLKADPSHLQARYLLGVSYFMD